MEQIPLLLKKLPHFMLTAGSLPRSQKPTTCQRPETFILFLGRFIVINPPSGYTRENFRSKYLLFSVKFP